MNQDPFIERARRGDEAAWVALVRHHQEDVFRLAYLLLGEADEADDVAQETFIRAFRALDQFDSQRPLRPWLMQITRNLARNRQRVARRYLAALRRWFDADRARPPARVEAATAQQLETERLWQAVGQLKLNDQEVIYLRYFLEFSVADAALALDVAEGTVKSRLSRALERLRRTIAADFPDLHPDSADSTDSADDADDADVMGPRHDERSGTQPGGEEPTHGQ